MDLYGFFYSSKFALQALQLQYYSFEKQKNIASNYNAWTC